MSPVPTGPRSGRQGPRAQNVTQTSQERPADTIAVARELAEETA
jgi:hypothetical protein